MRRSCISSRPGREEGFSVEHITAEERIARALLVAQGGVTDEAHHLKWVIDQMVRSLTGCPDDQQVSDAYRAWVRAVCAGSDGPETYEWDCGIAP